MGCRLQFSGFRRDLHRSAHWIRIALALVFIVSALPRVQARQSLPGAIGTVRGGDVSVENGVPGDTTSTGALADIFLASGSVVTVHSGHARMTLTSGGEAEICGPAKFTILHAADAITLALDFGQVHITLPGTTDLKIFTPTIIATPIDIGGATRDFSVGLNLDNSLCVLATGGALRVEQQFTGDKLVIPQSGEFSLAAGTLSPVAGAAGGCRCVPVERIAAQPSAPPSPAVATNAAESAPVVLPPSSAPAKNADATQIIAPDRSVEYSRLAASTNAQPNVAAKNPSTPVAAVDVPIYTVVAPPLVFNAGHPTPSEPSPDLAMLIRSAQVQPDWQFTGHVGSPEFVKAMQNALGTQTAATAAPASKPAKQKSGGGFWAGMKRIFFGSKTK